MARITIDYDFETGVLQIDGGNDDLSELEILGIFQMAGNVIINSAQGVLPDAKQSKTPQVSKTVKKQYNA
jgi:hypothetical protein